MAAAMKDVIGAAAGLSAFAIESARDLIQFMVRRGQMTQEEADKLLVEAETAYAKKHKGKLPPAKSEAKPAAAKSAAKATKPAAKKAAAKPAAKKAVAKKPAAKK
jgi:polyhydroxyalkanoate synthesis regulator phasin